MILSGLGDCPAIAPYPNLAYPGRCTNVPTDQQTGGSAATAQTGGNFVVDASIVAENAAARFGLQATPDRATQERLVAEAVAEGARRGIPVSCDIIRNSSPAYGDLPESTLYTTSCVVNGQPGNSAALMLRENGFNVATATLPVPVAVAVPPSTPVAAVLPATVPTSTTSATGGGFNQTVAVSPGQILSNISDQANNVAGSLGVPSWAIWAVAGLAAMYAFGKGR